MKNIDVYRQVAIKLGFEVTQPRKDQKHITIIYDRNRDKKFYFYHSQIGTDIDLYMIILRGKCYVRNNAKIKAALLMFDKAIIKFSNKVEYVR